MLLCLWLNAFAMLNLDKKHIYDERVNEVKKDNFSPLVLILKSPAVVDCMGSAATVYS